MSNEKPRFWETQPVRQINDAADPSLQDGPIEQPTPVSDVKQEPYNLPALYEWTTCDIEDDQTCAEVCELLSNNFVVDDGSVLRFNYTKEFLHWALRPPGYFKSWHIGVRVTATKKLVSFIAGVPARIRVRNDVFRMAVVNLMCIHKKLRLKRLAPVMIREITRRVHLENIWQAAYATGFVLPTPITTCRHWHRSLNPKKLVDIGFYKLGARMKMRMAVKLHKLPEATVTPGFRKMELPDVPAVTRRLRGFLGQFVVAPDFDEKDVEHWLLPAENVINSYVVESPSTKGDITDFCSFYTLSCSILNNQHHSVLKGAYCYYNSCIKTPLPQLMNDALIEAKKEDYDVFNALDIMRNLCFLRRLKFGAGDGRRQFYLYNYRIKQSFMPSGLGLVLL